jgi:hypothetical protein
VNSDIVSDDFWCVSVRCWASHFVLHWLSFRFRQGSPRQRIVPPRSRTHVWIYNYIIYIYMIYNIVYIYTSTSVQFRFYKAARFLPNSFFSNVLRFVSSVSWAVGPWLRHGIFLRIAWMSKEGDVKGETLRKNGRICDEKNVKRKIC